MRENRETRGCPAAVRRVRLEEGDELYGQRERSGGCGGKLSTNM
jgi:hypothetical protein